MVKFIVRIKDPYDNGTIDVIRFSKRDAENYLQKEIILSKKFGIEITGEIIRWRIIKCLRQTLKSNS